MSDASPSEAATQGQGATDPPAVSPEVRELQKRLLSAQRAGKGIRKAFDDFCAVAFSKPEWVGVASPFLAEAFEQDEERLALIARVPDMIIELSEGYADMTCIVASHWAIGGELENLNRLAEAMIAAHSRLKGEAVVELMLALCTSLAVVRHSRAEQLMEIVRPSVVEDQLEALRDAELWLSVGKILRTATTEQRRMWNERLRKARTRWTWESAEELRALRHLFDHIGVGVEGAHMFRSVVPPAWWDLALDVIRDRQEQAKELEQKKQEPSVPADRPSVETGTEQGGSSPSVATDARSSEIAQRNAPRSGRAASGWGQFVAGWIGGASIMALAMWLIPDEPKATEAAGASWRQEQLTMYEQELADLSEEHDRVKSGSWEDHSALLMGTTSVLPRYGNRYRLFLEWLQLDPPADPELRAMIGRLMYERFPDPELIDLWEKLASDQSVDVTSVRQAARDALEFAGSRWSENERQRLEFVADG